MTGRRRGGKVIDIYAERSNSFRKGKNSTRTEGKKKENT